MGRQWSWRGDEPWSCPLARAELSGKGEANAERIGLVPAEMVSYTPVSRPIRDYPPLNRGFRVMSSPMIRRLRPIVCCLLLLIPVTAAAQQHPLEFHLSFDRSVSAQPFTGRVYVMLFKQDAKELRSGPNWLRPDPFFARDVKDWKPGQTIILGGDALAYPVAMAKVPKAVYSIQAVMDFDPGALSFSTAEGNGHSQTIRREVDGAIGGSITLKIDK